MTAGESLKLAPDQFAFLFEGKAGVEADALANFLKRASAVARNRGVQIRVVGVHDGSLAVILKAFPSSAVFKNAKNEFVSKPIDTTTKVTAVVAAVVFGITQAMSPEKGPATPIAKAGASIVQDNSVNSITIVTNNTETVVMNSEIAKKVQAAEARQTSEDIRAPRAATPSPQNVIELVKEALSGTLMGEVVAVEGQFHFRPDRFRFLVPIDDRSNASGSSLTPGQRVRVTGTIETLEGQPDRLILTDVGPP